MLIDCIFALNCSCDADPSALAKYVVALVKKDKTEKELKALCIDQLDVFLQKGRQSLTFKQTVFCLLDCITIEFDLYIKFLFQMK